MASLDWIVIVLFFCAIIWIVYKAVKKNSQGGETSSDYFLSGRNETWIAVGAAIFAANIGSEHLVGLSGAGAQTGMAMAHWEMQGWMILLLGWIFVPFYAHSKVFTMPEFLMKRFTKNTSSTLSIITLVSYVLTKVSVTAFTGGIFLESLLGLDFWYGAIGLVVLTGIFTVFGGMKGVMTISVIQTPILILGSIAILILGLLKLGDGSIAAGWASMLESAGNNRHLIHADSADPLYSQFPGIGVIIGAAIIGFWYWCTDQHIVQRVLAAKNLDHARKGTIFAGYLKVLPVFMFLIPGMIAAALRAKGVEGFDFTAAENDKAFGAMVLNLLPIGMKGFVTVGFISALVTSLAAHFNSSATLFTIDFYKQYKPDASEAKLVWIGRMATIAVVVLGLIWIPVMRALSGVLYEYLQNVQSLIAPAIAAVFIMGVFSKKITPKAGELGLLVGFLIGMFRLIVMIVKPESMQWFLDINWLIFCIFLFIFTMVFMVIVSLFTKQASYEKLQGITYFTQSPAQRAETKASWSAIDIFTSIGVVIVCILFYIYFW